MGQQPAGREPVVAFVGPLSGGEAVVAVPMARSALAGGYGAAADEDLALEFRAVDDRRDPERAAAIVAALGADERVIGVVGPKNSGSALAAVPEARRWGLPLVLPAATHDDLCTLGGGVVFRMCSTDAATARAAVDVCRRHAVDRLCVRADSTAYGQALAEAVRGAASAAGLDVVIDPGRAGAVFHAMGEVEEASALRELRAGGFSGLLIGAGGGPGAPIGELAGGAAEGAYELYAGAAVPGARSVYTAEAEDAAAALVHAFAGGGGRAQAASRLCSLGWQGRSGAIAFDERGERVAAGVTVWRVEGGHSVPEPQASEVSP